MLAVSTALGNMVLATEPLDIGTSTHTPRGAASLDQQARIATDPKIHYGFPRLVRAANGNLLVFYRVGTSHAYDDSRIALRHSTDDGQKWSAERILWKAEPGLSAHNPVALVTPSGKILLWVSAYRYSSKPHARLPGYWSESLDHGKTWSPFVRFDNDPNRSVYYVTDAIVASDGLLIAGDVHPAGGIGDCHTLLFHSTDDGRSWSVRSGLTGVEENKGDEVALLETRPGVLLCLLRDRQRKEIYRYWSRDAGRTWSTRESIRDMLDCTLQRPFLTRVSNDAILLSGRDFGRKEVVAFVSRDGGRTFAERRTIESYQGDGGYTAAARLDDSSVRIVWYADSRATLNMPDVKSARLTIPARSAEDGAPAKVEQLRAQRRKLAHRQRRILFDNDGNEPVYLCNEATREALLAPRTTPLADTQVDSIFYCTWSSGFSLFTHATKIGQVFTSKANPRDPGNTVGGFSKNLTAEFIAKGLDPLRVMVDWAHEHDKEFFWSFRMNDTHDGAGAWYSPHVLPDLKKRHPEWLLGNPKNRPKRGKWSAVNFGREEIRDLAFQYCEEVCQNYDVDGIQLDFQRHYVYFKGPASGRDANDDERSQMTSLIRRIREMTEQVGLKRGRPILVSIRVPDSVGYCRAMGLDVERWLEEGLVDMMAVSCYFRLNPWEVSVALGHKHGVPVYPCLSETRMSDAEAQSLRASDAAYRGRAMAAWAAGADGIYMFNLSETTRDIFKQMGSPASMKTLDKVYTTGARGVRGANSWLANGLRFLNRKVVSPESPLVMRPGKTSELTIDIGDDMQALEREGSLPRVQLRIRPVAEMDPARWSIRWEGEPLQEGRRVENWIEYSVDPRLVRRGANRLALAVASEGNKEVKLNDLVVWVRFPQSVSFTSP